jgi:hypothetical protein
MRTLAHISNSFWNSAVPSLSRESRRTRSDSDCSHSLFLGEGNSGSMPTEVL